jgi:hypothetical protein
MGLHVVGITCSNTDGALRTCHSRVQHCIAHCTGGPARGSARHGRGVWRVHTRPAGRGSGEVREVLAQASWPVESRGRGSCLIRKSARGTALYELKGMRSDRSYSN